MLITRDNNPIPLKDVTLDVCVIDSIAQFTMFQTYQNSDTPAEIFYKFPVPADSSVYDFYAAIGDRVIKTTLKEKEQATREYNEAIARGDSAFLLNRNEGDVFSCCLGNIEKDAEILVAIRFATPLKTEIDAATLRLVVPTTLMPRYQMQSLSRGVGVNSRTSTYTDPSYTTEKPYTQTIKGVVHMADGIESFNSVTNGVKLTGITENSLTFTIDDIADLSRNVIILIKRKNPQSSAIIEEMDCDTQRFRHVAMLNIVPTFDNVQPPRPDEIHYCLIIDSSGSMTGENMTNAKDGAMIYVDNLPEGSTFDVYHFGSYFSRFTGTGPTKKADAIEWISKIEAGGGTELYNVLVDAYQQIKTIGKSGTMLIITDGGISDVDSVTKLVKANPNVTVFTVGVGSSVSHQLVDSLAAVGHGKAEYVNSKSDELLTKMVSQLQKSQISSRLFQKGNRIDVVTDSGNFELVPDTLPTLFENELNVFYVFSDSPIRSVSYSSDMMTQPQQVPIISVSELGHPIHRMAGVCMIQSIQASRSGSQIPDVAIDVSKEKIVEVSKALGVLSKHTSFIGVQYRRENEKLLEPVELKVVPLQAQPQTRSAYFSSAVPQMMLGGGFRDASTLGYFGGGFRDASTFGAECFSSYSKGSNRYDFEEEDGDMGGGMFDGPVLQCGPSLLTQPIATNSIGRSKSVSKRSVEPEPKYSFVLSIPYEKLGTSMLTGSGKLSLPAGVGSSTTTNGDLVVDDIVEILNFGVEGLYKVIHLGDDSTKWILRRINP